MSERTPDLAAYLTDHPRMTGVLFVLALLASQAGTAAAAMGGTYRGP